MLEAWLKELIAIPSPSGGEGDLAAYLAAWGQAQGFEVHTDAGNVMVRVPGADASRAVVLHAHMDVVTPGDPALWTTPPYDPSVRDGRLYGSGASDDKAGIAVGMTVAVGFAGAPPPVDLWLVWVVCEETDGSGSIAFADWFAARWQARYREIGAILFESTECRWLEYEAKGSLFLRITTEGGTGHAAMKATLGPSAIARMAEAVPRLHGLEAGWRRHGHLEPTALVTGVRAGDLAVPNRLDGKCELVVDIRTTAAMHAEVLPDVARALAGVPHRLEVMSACPPGYTDPDAPFIQAFSRMYPEIEKIKSLASNDLFAFTAIALPAFVFGPGSKEAIHRPDEYVELALVARCVEQVGAFVRSFGSA